MDEPNPALKQGSDPERDKRDPALEQRLLAALNGARFGQPCYAFQELASTMDVAHQLALDGAPEGACVWAETQTKGRGRAGRQWASAPGGIYLSLVLRPTRAVSELPQLALVAGLATAQAIHELANLSPTIRWPNDVFLSGQKVAGILIEAKSSSRPQSTVHSPQSHVIIGIGVNVTTDPRNLPEGATTLDQHAKPALDRFVLAATLFRHLEQAYQQWNANGFAAIRPALIPWVGLFGQPVTITAGSRQFEGTASDLDDAGRLLVRLDSGLVRAFEVGEVTLLR
jgi:BirA family biotin operon repressor/biotin-[acetyl-CoA-carboxylase] ligase